MTEFSIGVLRGLLAVLFVGCATGQVMAGELAALIVGGVSGVVLAALIVVGCLCVEAVLVSVWMLAGMARTDAIFDGRRQGDRWVNLAIGALTVAAVVATAGCVYFLVNLVSAGSAANTAMAIVTAVAAGVVGALALVVIVMRRLLHMAIQYQSDLSEVI
ncbi:hypothetical protein B7R22_16655 [Subtercola boreus]|uniref:ABC transporter n=1 Tax=Subtercola boreus TaxID=120213 RepID=A0A3E0VTN5_9MICO|nr:DUF2975 domain-containing protein [Subtercola boreus]RFA12257.1 hypothetical protein B7R22_16655 [Subtercola boreus]